jgi:queuine tRNA-ribosyltransferase
MTQKLHNFIPVLSSEAGTCLTGANWREAESYSAAYYLDSLLLKPGFDLLKKIPDLASYLGWSGTLILNASNLRANKEGVFTLISPYDGSKIRFSFDELLDLVLQLKPDMVLLPEQVMQHCPDVWDKWNDDIMPFLAAGDLAQQELHRDHGIYHISGDATLSSSSIEHIAKNKKKPCYLSGKLGLDLIKLSASLGMEFIESDEPASLAMQGQVYSREGVINLIDVETELDFSLIDSECLCPTCTRRLTKAYLHHLFLHTPLLCQRFLIQHNVFQVNAV